MTEEEFEKKVRLSLKKLNKRQKVHFAWKYAIRSLPYLTHKGGRLSAWNSEQMYFIFRALDISALYSNDATSDTYVSIFASSAAHDALKYVASPATIDTAAYHIAYIVTYTAKATTYAVEVNSGDNKIDNYVYYVLRITKIVFDKSYANLLSQILRDLNLESYHEPTEQNQIIWDSFQMELYMDGLSYWGKVYRDIFDNNFHVDIDQLKYRLDGIPLRIRNRGALEVALYIEEIGRQKIESPNGNTDITNKPLIHHQNDLKEKLAQGKIANVIQILLDNNEYKDYTNLLYQVQGRHEDLVNKTILGVVCLDDELIQNNKIRNALLNIIDKVG